MTILNVYCEASVLLVLSILPVVAGLVLLFLGGIEGNKGMLVVGALFFLFGAVFGLFFVPTYQYYEAIVDNISQIDFKKFEIVSQRGEIFVLKDLESVKYLWR